MRMRSSENHFFEAAFPCYCSKNEYSTPEPRAFFLCSLKLLKELTRRKIFIIHSFQGLIRANEEFVAEVILYIMPPKFLQHSILAFQVERLYVEEERWEGESERLREEADQLREQLSREVEAAQVEVRYFTFSF